MGINSIDKTQLMTINDPWRALETHWAFTDAQGRELSICHDALRGILDPAFKVEDARVLWRLTDSYQNGNGEKGVRRAVNSALAAHGLRYRFFLENVTGTDDYWIIKLDGTRALPAAVRKVAKALALRASTCTTVEGALTIINERDALERSIAPGYPLDYDMPGRSLSPCSKYGFESLEVGDVELRKATPGQLHSAWAPWAWARGMDESRIRCLKVADGFTAIQRLS